MRNPSVNTRLVASFAALGMLAAPVAAASPVRALPEISPVRCNHFERNATRPHQPQLQANGPISARRTGAAPPPPPSGPIVAGLPPVANRAVAAEARRDGFAIRRGPNAVLPYPYPPQPQDRARYAGKEVASIKSVAQEPVSTFSVDVDTGSYANVRRFLTQGQTPPVAAVRTEEMLNYFRYDYETPVDRSRPFAVATDMAVTPWNPATRLLRIGIKGYDLPRDKRPPANLVFLVDVSGSMAPADRLPLVKTALSMLADRLTPRDKVSIVVYAGAAGLVLEPTSNPRHIKAALDCLDAGGSTAGGQGLELAYATARAHYIKGGVNRVIMATDGDFNVGISSNEGIEAIVRKNRESGITLTTLGFGQDNYNEAMMERVADIGNGNYAYIDSAIEAQKVLDEEMAATLFTIAKDVKIQLEFNPAHVKEYRLIGYENRALAEEDFDNDKVDAGDIGAGHQVTALYEIVPAGSKGWLPDRRYEANRDASYRPDGANGELGWLKLRYKLPEGGSSMLIEKPLAASMIARATAPRGDMAFVCAVAAFGQKLRGDKYLGDFSFDRIRALAGSQNGYLRSEFVKLIQLADRRQLASAH